MVHRIRLRLSNAFLVVEGRPVLVDTGSPGEAQRIIKAMARLGVGPADVSLILHTHVHFDHVGSTAELRQLGVKAPIACYPADEPLMKRGNNGPLRPIGVQGRIFRPIFSNARFAPVVADVALADGMRLDEFGVKARILHTPGHTAGSISALLDSGAAIAGDLLAGGFLGGAIAPRRPMYPYFAEDVHQLQESLARLLAERPSIVHVGHGGPLEPDHIRARFPMGGRSSC